MKADTMMAVLFSISMMTANVEPAQTIILAQSTTRNYGQKQTILALILLETLALYKSFSYLLIHLLTYLYVR